MRKWFWFVCLPAFLVAGILAAVALAAGTATVNTYTYTVPGYTVAPQTYVQTVTVPTVTETTTVGTTTTQGPPPAVTPGIGVLDETGHLGNVADPSIYSMLIGGAYSSDVASVIEKAPGRGLVYFDGTDVKQSYSTGVPYSDASANGWLLKDSGGNLLFNSTYGSYCADVGSVGYQNEWVTNVESYLSSHAGVDGIFIDNVLYDPKGDCGAYPAKYPSTAAWSAAMVSFTKAVYQALHPLGYYVAVNSGAYKSGDPLYNDGTSTANWWQQLGPYADGLTNENYDQTSQGLRSSAVAWTGYFDGWQKLIGTAQGLGDDFIGITYGSSSDTTAMTYGKASFLLEWDGGGSAFIYKLSGSSSDPTNAAWTTDIGYPAGSKFAVGVGYERAYTKGTVLVNPSPSSSQTFTVNGTSYTLAPTTAQILVS